MESRGEGGREVKAGGGPGVPAGGPPREGRCGRGHGMRASWLKLTHVGGITALLEASTCRVRAGLHAAERSERWPKLPH